MPLKKLWNSLCGRPTEQESVAAPPIESPTAALPRATSDVSVSRKAASAAPPSPIDPIAPPRRKVLSMVTRGEHDRLIKAIRDRSPESVLEIGVGDGSRMPAILSAIGVDQNASNFKAAVIDQFEMGNGSVQMRDYHKRLVGLPIRPAIFPESAERGVVSVANRLGRMDVILIDESLLSEEAGEARAMLLASINKVIHPATLVMSNVTGTWSKFAFDQTIRRAA